MKCSKCNSKMRVADTREGSNGQTRRYACPCGHRLSTREMVVESAVDEVRVTVALSQLRNMRRAAMLYDRIQAVIADGDRGAA